MINHRLIVYLLFTLVSIDISAQDYCAQYKMWDNKCTNFDAEWKKSKVDSPNKINAYDVRVACNMKAEYRALCKCTAYIGLGDVIKSWAAKSNKSKGIRPPEISYEEYKNICFKHSSDNMINREQEIVQEKAVDLDSDAALRLANSIAYIFEKPEPKKEIKNARPVGSTGKSNKKTEPEKSFEAYVNEVDAGDFEYSKPSMITDAYKISDDEKIELRQLLLSSEVESAPKEEVVFESSSVFSSPSAATTTFGEFEYEEIREGNVAVDFTELIKDKIIEPKAEETVSNLFEQGKGYVGGLIESRLGKYRIPYLKFKETLGKVEEAKDFVEQMQNGFPEILDDVFNHDCIENNSSSCLDSLEGWLGSKGEMAEDKIKDTMMGILK